MLSAFAPMLIDRRLDRGDIVSGDSPFSDRNGQHSHCITEKGCGRQPKMKKNEKNLTGRNLTADLVENWVYPMKFCEADPFRDFFGVEMKNRGLKIGEFSACWTY